MSRRTVLARRLAEQDTLVPPAPPPAEVVQLHHQPPRGTCPRCCVVYAPRALRGHLQHCTSKPVWPGLGPQPMVFINNGQPLNTEPIVAGANGLPANSQPSQVVSETAKGDCPKCGKSFPRGLNLHSKHCKAT